MRRAEALQSLSHDHHHALFVSMKLKRATAEDAEAVASEFLAFWDDEGRRHFREEEEILLPRLARVVDPTDPAIVRVLTDHVEIRRRAADLAERDAAPADLVELGERLEQHVRHEERVLFPRAESALGEQGLADLAEALGRHG